MKYLVSICFSLYILISISYANDMTLIEQASNYYKNNKFENALSLYESLHKKFPNNIDIIYNLGNTHFKLNNHGYAIGFYLKAIKWDPSNSDIRYNLSLARELVQSDSEQENSIIYTILGWLRFLSINVSFNIMMILLLGFLATLRFIQLQKFNRELLFNILIVCGLFFILSFSMFLHRYAHYSEEKGVVITKKLAVYSGPSETLSILFYIHEGYEFRINKFAGDWIEIELSNGFKGWAPISGLFLI